MNRWLLVGLLLLTPSLAHARTLCVNPTGSAGCFATVQQAVDAAAPKDTVRVAAGTYPEAVVIDKRLRIIGTFDTLIDGGCTASAAVTITADGVLFENIGVRGGTLANIDVENVDGVSLEATGGLATCPGVAYGIKAVNATRLLIKNSGFFNFPGGCGSPLHDNIVFGAAAIYISRTPANGRVTVLHNLDCNSATGILVEDTVASPTTGPPSVTVLRNMMSFSERGIFLSRSDGVAVRSNRVVGPLPLGTTGIEVGAGSDNNVIVQNHIDGYAADVSDAGTSNCWRSNHFTTGSVPSTGCP